MFLLFDESSVILSEMVEVWLDNILNFVLVFSECHSEIALTNERKFHSKVCTSLLQIYLTEAEKHTKDKDTVSMNNSEKSTENSLQV